MPSSSVRIKWCVQPATPYLVSVPTRQALEESELKLGNNATAPRHHPRDRNLEKRGRQGEGT